MQFNNTNRFITNVETSHQI